MWLKNQFVNENNKTKDDIMKGNTTFGSKALETTSYS